MPDAIIYRLPPKVSLETVAKAATRSGPCADATHYPEWPDWQTDGGFDRWELDFGNNYKLYPEEAIPKDCFVFASRYGDTDLSREYQAALIKAGCVRIGSR